MMGKKENMLILKRALKLCMRWTRLCVIDQKVCGLSKTFFPPTTMSKKIPSFYPKNIKFEVRWKKLNKVDTKVILK